MNSTKVNSLTVAWMVWFVASIFYAYQYILRVMPSIILEDIMSQFHMNAAMFGQFSGVYYIGYSLMHLPIGLMLDRVGPRKIMTGCIFMTVLGLMPLVMAHHWIYPLVGRLLIGLGSSAAILGVFKVIRITFSERQFPKMLSFSVTIGLLGAIYGGGPVSYLRDSLGYETVVLGMTLLGVVLGIFTYWIIPEVKGVSQSTVLEDIREVASNRKVVFLCLCAGLMVGPLEGFADIWASIFFKEVYRFDGALASSMPSMIFMGMCFGSPILSFVADRLGSYLGVIVGSGFVMGLAFFFLLQRTLSTSLMSICFLVVGVCSAYQILAIYKASTYVKEQVAGLTTAVANMIIMTFGYLFHTVIGGVINKMGGTTSSPALVYGISVIPLAMALGVIGFSWIWLQEVQQRKRSNSFEKNKIR